MRIAVGSITGYPEDPIIEHQVAWSHEVLDFGPVTVLLP